MRNSILQSVAKLQNTSVLQSLHLFVKAIFKVRGYRWEMRRTGDTQLGYWRKSLRTKNPKSAYPKRLVLLPGFGDTPISWYIVLILLQPILKKNYDEVILVDFPGFAGFLSKERSFPSIDLMMKVVNDTLDSLKPHTILGHSLGGWLAAHYAALCGSGQRPSSNPLNYAGPQKIILANPSGAFLNEKVKEAWSVMFRKSMKEGFSVLRPHLFAKEPAWFRWIAPHMFQFLTREDVIQFMDSFREEHALDQSVCKIQCEVWLIWGEKDTLIPASCADAWLRHLNARKHSIHHAVLIRNVGHSPHLEAPASTSVILAQILSGKFPHPFRKRWWIHEFPQTEAAT